MNVVIFSGGSGSVQINKGLKTLFGDCVNTTNIINCYDHGKSTGIVRQVFSDNGGIGGPSDLRKLQLLYAEESALKEFLEHRFDSKNAKDYVMNKLYFSSISEDKKEFLKKYIVKYFNMPLVSIIKHEDFSIGNIIYGALAAENGNSMQKAEEIMKDILGINNRVILNDDNNMYIGGITESGIRLYDEVDLDEWNNPYDKIDDIFFFDSEGKEVQPVLSDLAKQSIEEADLVIFSSGTYWTSLIPIYKSKGFKEVIDKIKAPKYLVMNATADTDMTGVRSDEIQTILNRYFDMNKVTTLFPLSDEICKDMKISKYEHINCNITNGTKHDPALLIKEIFKDAFSSYTNFSKYAFDFDDTLKARDINLNDISKENIELFNNLNNLGRRTAIVTGKAVKNISPYFDYADLYCDGGANLYNADGRFIENISDTKFTNDELDYVLSILRIAKVNFTKIEIKNGCSVTIKFLLQDYKELLQMYLEDKLPDYKILGNGTTTIDIVKKNLDKINVIPHLDKTNLKDFLYVGDEWYSGNDSSIYHKYPMNFFKVNSVKDTNILLKVLTWTLS